MIEFQAYFSELHVKRLNNVDSFEFFLRKYTLKNVDGNLLWEDDPSYFSQIDHRDINVSELDYPYLGFSPFYLKIPFRQNHTNFEPLTFYEPYKARTLYPTHIISVYKNLHKDCYSIKQCGRVVAHTNYFTINDPQFHVNELGRQKVLKEKRKNVHAYITGVFSYYKRRMHFNPYNFLTKVTYNPYKHETFIVEESGLPIKEANFALVSPEGVFVC